MTERQPAQTTLDRLECSMCGKAHAVDEPQTVCSACGETLLARYRLDEAAATLTADALAGRRTDQWVARLVFKQALHGMPPVHQRQNTGAKERKVTLESPSSADPLRDLRRLRVPEAARLRGKEFAAPSVKIIAPAAFARAHKLEQLVVLKFPVSSDAQLEARKLRRAEIDGNDTCRAPAQHSERVITGRGDRQTHLPRLDI